MERHKCKLCSRSFSSGRALGGHMRSHLATLPLPPKTPQKQEFYGEFVAVGGGDSTESTSSECFEEDDDDEQEEEEVKAESTEEKGLVYGLRENPKKSFRLVDPEFLDAGSVVQDRESETESTRKPTRRRSKRTRRMLVAKVDDDDVETTKEQKMIKPSSTESLVELEPVSSVSDTSPEEDLALSLIMLSRDVWSTASNNSEVLKLNQNRKNLQCEVCNRVFTSSQALGSHRTIHKKIKNCPEDNEGDSKLLRNNAAAAAIKNADKKVHECPFCGKVFGSGQALGGHKRSHLLSSSTTPPCSTNKLGTTDSLVDSNSAKFQPAGLMIDLNLPAPLEDEDEDENNFCLQEASAVSDADFINPIKH